MKALQVFVILFVIGLGGGMSGAVYAQSTAPSIAEVDAMEMARLSAGLKEEIEKCTGFWEYLLEKPYNWEFFSFTMSFPLEEIVKVTDQYGEVLIDAIDGDDLPLLAIGNSEEGLSDFQMSMGCTGSGNNYVAAAGFKVGYKNRLMPETHVGLQLVPAEVKVTLPSRPDGVEPGDVSSKVWHEDPDGVVRSFGSYFEPDGRLVAWVPTYLRGTFRYQVTDGNGTVLLFGTFDPIELATGGSEGAGGEENGFSVSLAGGIQLVDFGPYGSAFFENQRLAGWMADPDCPEGKVCPDLDVHTYVVEAPWGLYVSAYWPKGSPKGTRILVRNQASFQGDLLRVEVQTNVSPDGRDISVKVGGGYPGKLIIFVTTPAGSVAGAVYMINLQGIDAPPVPKG